MDPAQCTVQNCDIFDFIALHVGFTVLHPGGFKATHTLADACGIDRGTRVLDIACGKGTTAVYLPQNFGCQVVGIDISKELIAQAEALAQRKGLSNRVTFREADALELPFQDNEFDIAVHYRELPFHIPRGKKAEGRVMNPESLLLPLN